MGALTTRWVFPMSWAIVLLTVTGTSPIRRLRPERKACGSLTVAVKAMATSGPIPGISSKRRLISGGETLIYLLSDNDFDEDHRTLLVMFVLED